MDELVIGIAGEAISGSGVDIIAPFTLQGQIAPDGTARIIKQYRRKHQVLYVGQHDGEGTFRGTWDIQGYQGEWLIRMVGPTGSEAAPIAEFDPR